MCSYVSCKDVKQGRDICSMHNDLVNALYECSKPYYKHKSKNNNIRPDWCKYVAKYHAEARKAFK